LRVIIQSRLFKEAPGLQLFADSLSQVGTEHYRGLVGLRPTTENPEPAPRLLERYYENVQDDAATAEILGLASKEDNAEEEEMPEEDFPDDNSGFHVDRSVHDGSRDRLQEPREEGEAEVATSQRRADEKTNWVHWIPINHNVWT
jgi:hypothetical protein